MSKSLTFAVVDGCPLLVEGLAQVLRVAGLQLCGSGCSRDDAITVARDKQPDLLIVDVKISGCGLEACREIAQVSPETKIVVLTDSEDSDHVSLALQIGARGYVLKTTGKREFVKIIGDIIADRVYVDPSLAARLFGRPAKSANVIPSLVSLLTPRERQILDKVAKGKMNKEIAGELGLGEKTVKHHMTNILQKLEVRNRVEACLVLQTEMGASHDAQPGAVGVRPSARSVALARRA